MRRHGVAPAPRRGRGAGADPDPQRSRIFAAWAPRYAARGLPVFPLRARGKEPPIGFGGGFKRATCDLTTLAAWADTYPTANVGLYPGGAGLLVFDADSDVGMHFAEQLGVPDHGTLRVQTRRGWHYYFRLEPDDYFGNVSIGHDCDIRAHAGYVIAPPSIHPSGWVYRWAEGCRTPAPLPDQLRAMLSKAQEVREVSAGTVPPGILPDLDTLERRVRAYIAWLPHGLPAGGGRNNAAFQLSAFLLRDLGIPQREAWPWVIAYNATHQPGLSESELACVFLSARQHASRGIGSGL